MKITLAIFLIPFRLIFSALVLLFMILATLAQLIVMMIQDKSFKPMAAWWKVMKESFCDAVAYPFWPLKKLLRKR